MTEQEHAELDETEAAVAEESPIEAEDAERVPDLEDDDQD
jgi:hypothetical protein